MALSGAVRGPAPGACPGSSHPRLCLFRQATARA